MINAYPRMYFWAAVFAVLFVLAVFFGIPVVHAQNAAPAAPPVGGEGILDVVRSSVVTGAVSLFGVLLAVVSSYLPAWLKALVDSMTTSEGAKWQGYVSTATGEAFDYARSKLGIAPDKVASWSEKNAVLRFAEEFMVAHYADIVSYVDKNGNGLPDILETALAKIAPSAPVNTPAPIEPEPMAAEQVQGLMSTGPVRRGVTKTPDALAEARRVAAPFQSPAAKSKLAGSRAMGSA